MLTLHIAVQVRITIANRERRLFVKKFVYAKHQPGIFETRIADLRIDGQIRIDCLAKTQQI